MLGVTPSSEQKYLGVAVNGVPGKRRASALPLWSGALSSRGRVRQELLAQGGISRYSLLEGHKGKKEREE